MKLSGNHDEDVLREEHLLSLYMELTGSSHEQARDVYAMLEASGRLQGSDNPPAMPVVPAGAPAAVLSNANDRSRISSGEPSTEILINNPRFA